MRKKQIVAGLVAGALMVVAVPAPSFANHDCGPPDKHNDHKFDQSDRHHPCK